MLSIVIVNYKSEQYLLRCLESLYEKKSNKPFEIIIINNDQQNDLQRIIEQYPTVTVIKNKKNSGFGAACNMGAKLAQGEIILFLNPDTQLLYDYTFDIADKFNQQKNLGVIGPRLVADNGKAQWWCAGKDISFWQIFKNKLGIIESKKIWESKDGVFADWVSGAALFVKKELFEAVDGFDEKMFMYFEDMDLCRRIRKLGRDVLFFPEISIRHSGGKSYEGVIRQKSHYFKSLLYYTKKKIKEELFG